MQELLRDVQGRSQRALVSLQTNMARCTSIRKRMVESSAERQKIDERIRQLKVLLEKLPPLDQQSILVV